MPYTPPSQRSPATSNSNSPVLSRNQSYDQSSYPYNRPALPRSRSASYLQRHRRTPSIADQKPENEASPMNQSSGKVGEKISSHGSLHPVIVTRFVESIGLTSSPVESPGSSEDDDENGRRRQLQDLATTLRQSMVVPKRPHSPTRTVDGLYTATPNPTPLIVTEAVSSPALTADARKISHSRSSSEIPISTQSSNLSAPVESSSDSEDDGLEMRRAPLLRKKSGELVKPALRPSSHRRPSSAPGTPTYSKAVHFNDNIEQVRHFLQLDRPIAVSAGSSPVEIYDSESDYPFSYGVNGRKARTIEWEIRTANFPQDTEERRLLPIRVERISLSSDKKNLVGTIAVANVAFQKSVFARFTFDYWKTTSEVTAEYSNDVRRRQGDGYDRFNFSIKISDQANLETKTLLLCGRYAVNGTEYWDNNNNYNFQVDFIKKDSGRNAAPSGQGAVNPVGTIPRSRHSANNTHLVRPRSFPASSDDEFSNCFGFGSAKFPLRESPNMSVRLKDSRANSAEPQRSQAPGNSFSMRYDFGASLSAALTTAQNALGDRSGLKPKDSDQSKPPNNSQELAPAVQPLAMPRPNSFPSGRPELHSAEYKDLIEKFCYFGSNTSTTGTGSPAEEKMETEESNVPQTDGIADSGSDIHCSSLESSTSNSPPSPKQQSHQIDGGQDALSSPRNLSPSVRATSPILLPYRSSSPAISAYQEFPQQGLSAQATQC